jgi:8-oxo-dGTP pyrophosphatase MutT (NUDIX family)
MGFLAIYGNSLKFATDVNNRNVGLMTFRDSLERYMLEHAAEEHATACMHFLNLAERPFDRESREGHFTGSAWLVDVTGERVLLTHHRTLQRWLQLGGHADGDSDLAAVALREACEESGLMGLVVEPAIFDVDRHWIPERKGEAGHWHYDVRYVVRTGGQENFVVSAESLELAWVRIRDLAEDASVDESLHRMARKWLLRCA